MFTLRISEMFTVVIILFVCITIIKVSNKHTQVNLIFRTYLRNIHRLKETKRKKFNHEERSWITNFVINNILC